MMRDAPWDCGLTSALIAAEKVQAYISRGEKEDQEACGFGEVIHFSRDMKRSFFLKSHLPPVICIGFMAGSTFCQGADFLWTGAANNDWATAANWSGNAVPVAGNNRINVGAAGTDATKVVDWDHRLVYSAAQGEMVFNNGSSNRALFIGNGSGTIGNMEITGGIFRSTSTDSDGMANGGGNAKLVISGGEYQKIVSDGSNGQFFLNFGAGTSLLEINSGAFRVNRLNFQGDVSPTVETSGVIQLNGGTLAVGRFLKSNDTSTHNVYLNGGTVASRLDNVVWADLANVTWTLQSSSTFSIGNKVEFAEVLGGVGGFTKSNVGDFKLTGANTYAGVTTVSEGALTVGNSSALGATGTGNGTAVISGGRVVLADGVVVTGESLTISGVGANNYGGLQVAAGTTGTWNGDISTTSASIDDTRIGAQLGGHLIIKGNINATAKSLYIRSEGADTLGEADFGSTVVTLEGTYTGTNLQLYQGVVKLGASERIANNTVVILGHATATTLKQRLDLNGFSETIARLTVSGSAASATHEVTNSSTTASTLTVNSSTNSSYSGILTGNLNFQKLGTNTLTYSGINTHTGMNTIGNGTFVVASGGALNGGGSTTVASGATFSLLGTYLFKIGANGTSNSISGAGTVNLVGILHLDLSLAALGDGNAWQLVDATGPADWTGAQVTSTAGDFSKTGEIWMLSEGDNNWSLNQQTGVLSLSVVPEPGQASLLLLGGTAFALRRRRSGRLKAAR
jgi:autotransporter-associated beta strand protein